MAVIQGVRWGLVLRYCYLTVAVPSVSEGDGDGRNPRLTESVGWGWTAAMSSAS